MEIIIVVAVLVGVALWWGHHVKTEKSKIDNSLDNWTPPKAEDKPWPYSEKLAEGKIHVKTTDVAPGKSADDRVEAPAPTVADATAENKAEAVAKAKKAPAKKTAAKPVAAKKAPAKKKST
jgi:hypothetical protein